MSARALAIRTLAADGLAVEAIGAMRAQGIPVLLLKGRSIAGWLYDGRAGERNYVDADLLVHPGRIHDAEETLVSLGFTSDNGGLDSQELRQLLAFDEVAEHAAAWRREGTPATIDLHATYPGVGADPATLFDELATDAETVRVAGEDLDTAGPPARAMMVALHAAWHGEEETKPLGDLARAVEHLPLGLWEEAADLAARLDATRAFAAGLRLRPAGAELADRLGLPSAVGVEIALRAQSLPPTSLAFERLAATQGVGRKLRLIARELVPSRLFMRHSSPLARRGRIGLAAAYLKRPFWIAAHAGSGFIVWRRARKEHAT